MHVIMATIKTRRDIDATKSRLLAAYFNKSRLKQQWPGLIVSPLRPRGIIFNRASVRPAGHLPMTRTVRRPLGPGEVTGSIVR